jgi:hypothetical protein
MVMPAVQYDREICAMALMKGASIIKAVIREESEYSPSTAPEYLVLFYACTFGLDPTERACVELACCFDVLGRFAC